jgi:LPS-assembly lipoprotein
VSLRTLLVALLTVALLTGCGFKLRGSAELPALYAQTDIEGVRPQTTLYLETRRALQAAGVTVVEAGAAPSARLTLEPAELLRRPLSVSADGQVLEHELRLRLRYRVEAVGGEFTLGPESVETVRVLSFDPTEVSAKTGEQEELRAAMVREAVNLMLLRLRAAAP